MRLLRKLWRRIRAVVLRRRLDAELDDEMAFHLEMEVDHLARQGTPADQVQRRARLAFGAFQRFREEARDARGIGTLDDLVRDLKHGFRSFRRRPLFTIVLLSTLSLGVGGAAAIFGAVNGILFTPLPYPDQDRVMTVWQRGPSGTDADVAPANFLDWRERNRSFEHLTAMEPYGLDWASADGPVHLSAWLVYEGFFETFGTRLLLGRAPRPDEHVAGRGDVVVLGHQVWVERFGGAHDVVGRVVSLDQRPYTIIGVMPAGFATPSDAVVWAPKILQGWETRSRTGGFYRVFGRLTPGVTLEQARREMTELGAALAREHPATNARSTVNVVPIHEQLVGPTRNALWLLLGAVGLVFAIVVANAVSLELARAVGRQREFVVREALGAARSRITRQLVTESSMIAVAGAGLGFGIAHLILGAIKSLAPITMPRPDTLVADGRVLVFAIAASLIAAMSTAIAPAAVAKHRLQAHMLEGGRSTTHSRRLGRLQSGLVVIQVALSLMLLVGAGLLLRSFTSVLTEDRGFRANGVAVVVAQSWSYYPSPAERINFVREVIERLEYHPAIQAAAMTSSVPLMESIGPEHSTIFVDGAPPPSAGEQAPRVHFSVVSPGFFDVLDIPVVRGRDFDTRDQPGSAQVAIVNQAFVRRYIPDEVPLGKRIRFRVPEGTNSAEPAHEIVGVVGDVRRFGLTEPARPAVYLPHQQSPNGANGFLVRGSGRAGDLVLAAKQVMAEINPSMPLHREVTMVELVGASVRERRFLMVILLGFAGLALGLAATGLFGLMSFTTQERTREIGVRMAFGASRHAVVGLVLRRGGGLALAGILLGAAGAAALTRVLGSMLYRVTPLDPAAFLGAATVLLVAALLATWYPAWRAASIDPLSALRSD